MGKEDVSPNATGLCMSLRREGGLQMILFTEQRRILKDTYYDNGYF